MGGTSSRLGSAWSFSQSSSEEVYSVPSRDNYSSRFQQVINLRGWERVAVCVCV